MQRSPVAAPGRLSLLPTLDPQPPRVLLLNKRMHAHHRASCMALY